MNITDLRVALREQAETVVDRDATQRVVQVHTRVRRVRRRRISGVAGLTVLALVGAVSVLPNRGGDPDDTGPAASEAPAPVPTIQHQNFVSHSGEFDLIAAKVGEPGQNTLELTVPAHRGEVYVSMVCYGPSGPADGYWVSGYVGDTRPDRPTSTWCGEDPSTPVVPGVWGERPGPWDYVESPTVRPEGVESIVHVELTQEVDENGDLLRRPDDIGEYVKVDHPDAVLGVGVYTVAEPVTTVAGTEIRPLVGLDGQDYAYEGHRVSASGERTLSWTLEPSARERYYDVVFSNALAPGATGLAVTVTLDSTSCRSSYSFERFRAGGCQLSPGEPHTITATFEGSPPADAVLGIVLYEQVPTAAGGR